MIVVKVDGIIIRKRFFKTIEHNQASVAHHKNVAGAFFIIILLKLSFGHNGQ